VPSDHAAVPAQQRLGPHQEHLPAVPRQQPRKEGQQCSVLGLQARPGVRAAENLQLMAEHQDLDLLGRSAAEPQEDQGEHSAKGEVHKRRQGQHSSQFEGERARRLPGH
jgi:hypothetical protein